MTIIMFNSTTTVTEPLLIYPLQFFTTLSTIIISYYNLYYGFVYFFLSSSSTIGSAKCFFRRILYIPFSISIFNESIFDVKGKDYPVQQKVNWEHIEKMAILAILVIAVGFIFIHVLLEFGAVMAILALVGMYTFYKILSNLILQDYDKLL